jgi:hypothetical protein
MSNELVGRRHGDQVVHLGTRDGTPIRWGRSFARIAPREGVAPRCFEQGRCPFLEIDPFLH